MELQKINLNLDSSIRRTVSYLIGYQHSSNIAFRVPQRKVIQERV